MLQVKDNKKKLNDFININTLSVFNKLIKNIIWVLFVFDIITFLFYILGNYFNYTDRTLLLLLKIISITSVLLSILSVIAFIENLIYIFFDKKVLARIISLLFMLLTFAVGILLIIVTTVLEHLAEGV